MADTQLASITRDTAVTVDFSGIELSKGMHPATWTVEASDGEFTSIPTNGSGAFDVVTSVKQPEGPKLPQQFALQQNFPNPFNPTTQIRYELPEAAHVELTMYNAVGQNVRVLVDETRAAGHHEIVWDGRDAAGNPVSSGVYVYVLRVSKSNRVAFVDRRKAILMK